MSGTSFRVINDNVTVTDVSGKLSQDVNVTGITLSANDDSTETRSIAMSLVVDEVSATLTYVGEANPGTLTSSALWRIKRISISAGITTIAWANGNGNFTNIWNNRASLGYS